MIQSNADYNIGSEVGLPMRQYGEMEVMEEHSSFETVRAMREQEEAHYFVENYFRRGQNKFSSECSSDEDSMNIDTVSQAFAEEPIDPECRSRMSEWYYQIVDFCGYKRETAAIAMSCLDRFIASKEVDHVLYRSRSQFQLASMVCFYSSIKIHEREAMAVGVVASLSRGEFQVKEIEEMEATMLNSIDFRMNPPTALAFSKHMLDLVPDYILSDDLRDTALELTKFQTEIVVSDVELMDIKSSLIALAALINSFDSLRMDTKIQGDIMVKLSSAINIDCEASVFRDVRIRLYEGLVGDGNRISPQVASPRSLSIMDPATMYDPKGSTTMVH